MAAAVAFLTLSLAALCGLAHGFMKYPMMNMGVMPHSHHSSHHHSDAAKYLTCQINFRSSTNPAVIVNAISVNIKERPRNSMSMGMSWLKPKSSHGHSEGPGLSADIGVFSSTGGKVTIAVTETGRPQDGCKANDFGYFLNPNAQSHSHASPMMGYNRPMMGYGMGGYGMGGFSSSTTRSSSYGMGMPMMGGMYGSPMYGGMMGYPMMGYHTHQKPPTPGVLAEHTVAPGVKASIVIDRIHGFDSLDDLAGRGLVVCPTEKVDDDDHKAKCEGMILSCCSLHYDKKEVMLGGSGGINNGGNSGGNNGGGPGATPGNGGGPITPPVIGGGGAGPGTLGGGNSGGPGAVGGGGAGNTIGGPGAVVGGGTGPITAPVINSATFGGPGR